MTTLATLEQQLAALKSTLQPVPIATSNNPIDKEDIRGMIKEILLQELNGIKESANNPEVKLLTLEESLRAILTGDEQTWLTDPENVKKMPNFIVSDVGKPLAQEFIKQFRGMYGN